MNNIWKRSFYAIIWKEIIEGLRKTKLYVLTSIIVTVGLQYIPVSQIANNDSLLISQKEVLLTSLTIYFPIMIIPLIGSTILSRTITEEKLQKSIHVLLACGVPTTSIWTAKFLVSAVISYITTLLGLLVYGLFIKLYVGYTLVFNSRLIVLTFLTMPLASIGILAIVGISYWTFRNSQILVMAVPLVSLLGTWNFVLNFGMNNPAPIVVIISLVIGICLLGISTIIIKFIPKEVMSES